MLGQLKKIYNILKPQHKKQIFIIQIFIILTSLMEVITLVIIGQFVNLISNINNLEKIEFFFKIYNYFSFASNIIFLIMSGIFVLFVLVLTSFFSIITIKKIYITATKVGTDIGADLYSYYLFQTWDFHIIRNSSQLVNNIIQESQRLTISIIIPALNANSKIITAFFLCVAIFIYSPLVSTIGILVFVIFYILFFIFIKERLDKFSDVIGAKQENRFKLMAEGFGGIKAILLSRTQSIFKKNFQESSADFAYALGRSQYLSAVPRYIIELVAFGSVIAVILFMLVYNNNSLISILPLLAIFLLAGFKLIPCFQQIYSSVVSVKSNLSAFYSIEKDLQQILKFKNNIVNNLDLNNSKTKEMKFRESILLRDVSFYYPNNEKSSLKDISIEIPINNTVGIVGPSGSGKSTIIDIILGLLIPAKGNVLIDNKILTKDNISDWQNNIGFVPQDIFLLDGSIKENIAFGTPVEKIDDSKIESAIKLSCLDEFIKDLKNGAETFIGENGVKLSGGQRQRIGIARSLYNNPQVLVFDEATNSLDGITEKNIMDSIDEFSGKKTIIIIAHRLLTLKRCNIIYLIVNGQIVDQGSYDELMISSPIFKKMSQTYIKE
jgi:ABC-type multidrug transport system fused ATPase/permease subunit